MGFLVPIGHKHTTHALGHVFDVALFNPVGRGVVLARCALTVQIDSHLLQTPVREATTVEHPVALPLTPVTIGFWICSPKNLALALDCRMIRSDSSFSVGRSTKLAPRSENVRRTDLADRRIYDFFRKIAHWIPRLSSLSGAIVSNAHTTVNTKMHFTDHRLQASVRAFRRASHRRSHSEQTHPTRPSN